MFIQQFRYILLFLFLGINVVAFAQKTKDSEDKPIQFSGLVLTEERSRLTPVPFTTIQITKKSRGVYSNYEGFFSLVAERGDLVTFSAVGFQTVEFIIPDTLKDDRYSVVQLMAQDTYMLPETVIFPWPSKDHFRLEFLAMDTENELQKRARENLSEENLARAEAGTMRDGNETGDYYLRQQAKTFYYNGQIPPMNIFNPMAWKEFYDSWKSGKYKRKRKEGQ